MASQLFDIKSCNSIVSERLLAPLARPSSIAPEALAFDKLPTPSLDGIHEFEGNLLRRSDAPLPSETPDDQRLLRNRYTRRLCALAYQTVNQEVVLESDLRLRRCDLLLRERVPFNNPSQWGPLVDSALPEAVPSKSTRRTGGENSTSHHSWNSLLQFFREKLGNSFHFVYVTLTDEALNDATHWAAEFLEWCFSRGSGKMFFADGTNLVFIPWLLTPNSSLSSALIPLCVRNVLVSNNEGSTVESISMGKYVRQLVVHRFALLKKVLFLHIEKAISETTPDLAEFCYTVQMGSIITDGVLNNTSEENRNTDLQLHNELRALVVPNQYMLYRLFSCAMRDPHQWTHDVIRLETSPPQNIEELYMNTIVIRCFTSN